VLDLKKEGKRRKKKKGEESGELAKKKKTKERSKGGKVADPGFHETALLFPDS